MRRTRWLALVAVSAAATGCRGSPRSAGETAEIEQLRQEVQELRAALEEAEALTTGKNVKRYFAEKQGDPYANTKKSLYSYVDSLALVVCQMKEKANAGGDNYNICTGAQRLDRVPPPKYPP